MFERLQAKLRELPVTKDTQHFFAEPVQARGVAIAAIRKLAAAHGREFAALSVAERAVVAERLWESGGLEEGHLAILLYARLKTALSMDEVQLFHGWLRQYVTKAEHADAIGMVLLGPALKSETDWAAVFLRWASAQQPWVRRAMLAAFSKAAREGRHREEIRELVVLAKQDPERHVRNAAAWLERLLCL